MKVRCFGAELVFGSMRIVVDPNAQDPHGVRGPNPAVLDTKRAIASARWNARGRASPIEFETDVIAMTTAVDDHIATPRKKIDFFRPRYVAKPTKLVNTCPTINGINVLIQR